MKETNKKKFSVFRKNRKIISFQVKYLLKEVKSKIIDHSYLVACPYITEENKKNIPGMFYWQFIKKGKDVIILENQKTITEFEFKNNLLFLLKNSSLVMLTLNNYTNQKYTDNKTEIIEVWGYKISLFSNLALIEKISSNDLLSYCTFQNENGETMGPEPHLIYCGPDGKIFGWDLI